jgi:hypothetical protein
MMKILTAASLAAGLVALSLPASAATSTTTGTPAFKPQTSKELVQVARNENPGGGMYKKSKKKKK